MTKNPDILLKKLGLYFNDLALFKTALTHRSASGQNNERLEFLGDAVLGFVIAEKLFQKFPKASEGILSRLRANLVNQTMLAEIASEHQLGEYLILGAGELKSGGFRRSSILSDALEAIIGAIVTDQDMDAARVWVLRLFSDRIDQLSLDNWEKDPKTQLQEFLQGRGMDVPEYHLVAVSGQHHNQHFKIECRVNQCAKTSMGEGSSRKKAEQIAAVHMLQLLVEQNNKAVVKS